MAPKKPTTNDRIDALENMIGNPDRYGALPDLSLHGRIMSLEKARERMFLDIEGLKEDMKLHLTDDAAHVDGDEDGLPKTGGGNPQADPNAMVVAMYNELRAARDQVTRLQRANDKLTEENTHHHRNIARLTEYISTNTDGTSAGRSCVDGAIETIERLLKELDDYRYWDPVLKSILRSREERIVALSTDELVDEDGVHAVKEHYAERDFRSFCEGIAHHIGDGIFGMTEPTLRVIPPGEADIPCFPSIGILVKVKAKELHRAEGEPITIGTPLGATIRAIRDAAEIDPPKGTTHVTICEGKEMTLGGMVALFLGDKNPVQRVYLRSYMDTRAFDPNDFVVVDKEED